MLTLFGLSVKREPDNFPINGETYCFTDKRVSPKRFKLNANQLCDCKESFKMQPEYKSAWLTALRSGEYLQGQSCLHEEIETGAEELKHFYCCLGVYCEVRHIPGVEIVNAAATRYKARWSYANEVLYLPLKLIPEVGGQSYQTTLASFNDAGWDFDEIANLLELCF